MYKRQEVPLEQKEHCDPFLKIKQDWKCDSVTYIIELSSEKVIQNIKMVSGGIKIGKEQFNIWA